MAWQNLPSTNTPVNATNLNSLSNSIIEGTWTPVISALSETNPTATYTTQAGKYKKIGKIVFFNFYIRAKITALNGTNNYAQISGLPYSVIPTEFGTIAGTLGILYSAINDDSKNVFVLSGTSIRVQANNGAAATKWIVTPTNYMEIGGSGFYFTN